MDYGNFNSFLERMSQLSYAEIVRQAQDECSAAGTRRTQTSNGQSYAARIKNFLYFLHEHQRPGNATAEDFHSYKKVIAALVDRGEFAESALEIFGAAAQLARPVAVCTRCGRSTHSVAAINQPCNNHSGSSGKRCAGCFGSAIGEADWAECPSCHATGRAGPSRCDQCSGEGWLYSRG